MDCFLARRAAPVYVKATAGQRDHCHYIVRGVGYRLRRGRIVFTLNDYGGNSRWNLYGNHSSGLWQLEPRHNRDRSCAIEVLWEA
jgi:hypothetical protein